ncbi:MAG: hypothetical protein M3Q50_12135, partial [Chloroflexota bacterium]|nr:hypothetical protein [Chloroflexota bacterium]
METSQDLDALATTAASRRAPDISRRGMLRTGIAAAVALAVGPGRTLAQDATPVATPEALTDEE